jgi:arylsulfatase A-like enzyme
MFRQRKISFRLLILLAFCSIVCGSAVAQPLRRLQDKGAYGKPNIILFVTDNFYSNDVELVLSNRSNFPNLNKLITNGIYYSHFYSVDTDSKQCRACLLTGIHPINKPLLESSILNPEFRTIADILKECGYRSGILGKWGLGGKPIGFNEWFGYLTDEEAQKQYPQFLWRNDKKWELPANQSEK